MTAANYHGEFASVTDWFEKIRLEGVESTLDMIRLVEQFTSGFNLDHLKALKEDLDIYVEIHLYRDVVAKYEKGRKSHHPRVAELIVRCNEELNKNGISSHQEGWGIIFEKIVSTWYGPSDLVQLGEGGIWEDLFFNDIGQVDDFIRLDRFIRKKIREAETEVDEHQDIRLTTENSAHHQVRPRDNKNWVVAEFKKLDPSLSANERYKIIQDKYREKFSKNGKVNTISPTHIRRFCLEDSE